MIDEEYTFWVTVIIDFLNTQSTVMCHLLDIMMGHIYDSGPIKLHSLVTTYVS